MTTGTVLRRSECPESSVLLFLQRSVSNFLCIGE